MKLTNAAGPPAAALVLTLLVSGCDRTHDEDAPHAAQAGAAQMEHGADGHDAHAVSAHGMSEAPSPPPGGWATDEPLRAAMNRLSEATQKSAPAYERGELQPGEARALADQVEREVAYMVENCRLEPDADAALHVLIGRMMQAATALRADPSSPAGMPQLHSVLNDYANAFDHPGWRSDAHSG